MKNSCSLFAGAVLALAASGCATGDSPYDYAESWLIREDPVRTYAMPSDVIYVQDALLDGTCGVAGLRLHADAAVKGGRFDGLARIFSPVVMDAATLEQALDWYFRHHHGGNRPFVFIGEGRGGALLRAYERENLEDLRESGLAVSFYCEEADAGFVTPEMVKQISDAVHKARFRSVWGRDMPEGADAPCAGPEAGGG
ncbi:MAG: hypothetical protein K6F50_09935 [Kiritimatiellae bacterium]|nr:hypothetical protein [Kiritimatiellia bacterium]